MVKKEYEAPVVTKVEIDFSDRIIAAGCGLITPNNDNCNPMWGGSMYSS